MLISKQLSNSQYKINMIKLLKKIYIRTTGYSYTHLGRLFLRLFVGVMMMQFGVRQIMDFGAESAAFPSIFGMSGAASLTMLIVLEMCCSLMVMVGFLTRLMVLPLFIAMIVAEWYLIGIAPEASYMISWRSPGYLPVMFLGIYFFILLVGPGKISVDYFLSLHFIHSDNKSESELEEV